MSDDHRHLLTCWLVLLVLGAIGFGAAFLPLKGSFRPLLLLPSLCMVAVVALMFMGARAAPSIARGFALAALFWLTVLLGLGMIDPLTRAIYPSG
jgi:cytochrome c oxidase subunit IV